MISFFKKLIIFSFIILTFQLIIFNSFHTSISPLVKNLIVEKDSVVYFGDSTIHTVGKKDEDQDTLYEMVSKKVSPLRLGVIFHDSYQADIYYAYSKEF